jgi:hypothetical protein
MSLSAVTPKIPESLQVTIVSRRPTGRTLDGQKISEIYFFVLAPKISKSLQVSKNKSQTKQMDFGWSFELKNVIICINTKHL